MKALSSRLPGSQHRSKSISSLLASPRCQQGLGTCCGVSLLKKAGKQKAKGTKISVHSNMEDNTAGLGFKELQGAGCKGRCWWLPSALCLAQELCPNPLVLSRAKFGHLGHSKSMGTATPFPEQGPILLLQLVWSKQTHSPLPQGIFHPLFNTTSTSSLKPAATYKL